MSNSDETLPDRDLSFSLILATVGRTAELVNFLDDLVCQSYPHFELVIIDQNSDDRLLPIISRYSERLRILHCRSAVGLSRARNVGLKHASGDFVAFPDDDCWYSPDLLKRVAQILNAHPEFDGITGRPIDKSFSRFHTVSGAITRENVFVRCSSVTIFLRRSVVDRVGEFDEGLGLGSTRGRTAAEESDYLIRAMAAGFRLTFDAGIEVFHSEPTVLYDANFNRKAYGYQFAFGSVLRKHRYPFWYVARTWLRALGGVTASVLALKWDKARYHWIVLKGRVAGWATYQ